MNDMVEYQISLLVTHVGNMSLTSGLYESTQQLIWVAAFLISNATYEDMLFAAPTVLHTQLPS